MKKLLLFAAIFISLIACKKKNPEPEKPADPEPVVIKEYTFNSNSSYSYRNKGKQSSISQGQFYSGQDTLSISCALGELVGFYLKAVASNTPGVYMEAFTKKPVSQYLSTLNKVKTGQIINFTCSYTSYVPQGQNMDSTYFKLYIRELYILEQPSKQKTVLFSGNNNSFHKDSMPFQKVLVSGNIDVYSASKSYTFTAP